jgi:hypothetical protein
VVFINYEETQVCKPFFPTINTKLPSKMNFNKQREKELLLSVFVVVLWYTKIPYIHSWVAKRNSKRH